jgi:anaerobic ribonucleoside-triphosphate reductase
MEFEFDFNVSAWMQGVNIEASSLDEAKEKLGKMSLADLVNEGTVKQLDITDLDAKETEATYEVLVTDVHLDPAFYEYDTEVERTEIANRNFGDFNFKLQLSEDEDFDDAIESALEESTELSGNWTYNIEVLKKY